MALHTITGKTKLVGIIGNPVSHSLSPHLHNHLFEKLGLPYAYVPLEVQREHLHTAIHALRACQFAGANVTIPYKQAVVPFCDTVSDLSKLTGTVNTLYWGNGLLHGTTTDAQGFFAALHSMNHTINGGFVVILGNGGTARTLGIALAHEKAINTLHIIGRNQSRVENLSLEITKKTDFSVSCSLFDSVESEKALKTCTLLVNCTSVGMSPHSDDSPLKPEALHKGITVFDAVYNPAETQLLKYAHAAGCQYQNGLKMLVYQGLASFTYWTGVEATIDMLDLVSVAKLSTFFS